MSGSGTVGVGRGEFDINQPIGGYKLPVEYADVLYELCQRIDTEIGTNNGSCALFWHAITIFDMHTTPREKLSIEEDF